MEAYNSTLDQSLYEAVSSAKSSVSTSSGLSTNSQTALLHKKTSHGKRSKRRPHSAIAISHLSHPNPTKLETLATFPPLSPNLDDKTNITTVSDTEKSSHKPTPKINTEKSKCQKCAIISLLIVLFSVLFALVLSIVLLVQLPSASSSWFSTKNSSLANTSINKVRRNIKICSNIH